MLVCVDVYSSKIVIYPFDFIGDFMWLRLISFTFIFSVICHAYKGTAQFNVAAGQIYEYFIVFIFFSVNSLFFFFSFPRFNLMLFFSRSLSGRLTKEKPIQMRVCVCVCLTLIECVFFFFVFSNIFICVAWWCRRLLHIFNCLTSMYV